MGYLVEANKSYSLVFEMIKVKMFGDNQRTTKLKILNKIVSLNNTKFSYDEAYIWAIKALECLDATDAPILVIETLNQSAKAFTEKSLKRQSHLLRSLLLSVMRPLAKSQ